MKNTILLVDDNEDLLKISGIILKSQGYTVFTATSVDSARQQITLHPPDLILLDVHICQEDGLVFCSELKQNADTYDVRVILMSGESYNKEEWNGADDFLIKPFGFETLTQKVTTQFAEMTHKATASY